MKLRERKFYSYVFDLPGHFSTPHSGENCLGKPEVRHHLKNTIFEYKSSSRSTIRLNFVDEMLSRVQCAKLKTTMIFVGR